MVKRIIAGRERPPRANNVVDLLAVLRRRIEQQQRTLVGCVFRNDRQVPVYEVDQTLDERRLLYAYRCLPRNERNEILRRVEVQSLNWRTPAEE